MNAIQPQSRHVAGDNPEAGSVNVSRRFLFNWVIVIFIWSVLAGIATTFSYDFALHVGRSERWSDLARIYFSSYLAWGILFTPVVVWVSLRFTVGRHQLLRAVLAHVATALAIAVVSAGLRVALHSFIYPDYKKPVPWSAFRSFYLANAYDDLWMYLVVAASAHGLIYFRKYQERELRSSELERQLAEAQLQMLKMQLQPHFLFNTLNTAYTLVRRDGAAAERVIIQLSDLLRMTLDHTRMHEVPLHEEIAFIGKYLEIEQVRFRERLTVCYNVEPDCLDAMVPNMILQPLVENAVRHGVAPHARPGIIEISAIRRQELLELTVSDNGEGITDEAHRPVRSGGVGLSNTRARLMQQYGPTSRLELKTGSPVGFSAIATIPFRKLRKAEPNLATHVS
ncbi:MAG: sensor histidine kinase [Acidobacteriaceae bacterium]